MQGSMLACTELGFPDDQSRGKAGPHAAFLFVLLPFLPAAQAQVIMNTQPFAPPSLFLHTLSLEPMAISPFSPLETRASDVPPPP